MKRIQFTSGCPNGCSYCYEPQEMKYYDPEIPEGKDLVQILDMNFLANPDHKNIIERLRLAKNKHYELICGLDYRLLTPELCCMLKKARFISIRWAWDYGLSYQKVNQVVWRWLKKAGYKSEELSIFMLVNWNISFRECHMKLDIMKSWNVKVNDCCHDGGYHIKSYQDWATNQNPKVWSYEDLVCFRDLCRKHNHIVRFKILPELQGPTIYNYGFKSPSAQLRLTPQLLET